MNTLSGFWTPAVRKAAVSRSLLGGSGLVRESLRFPAEVRDQEGVFLRWVGGNEGLQWRLLSGTTRGHSARFNLGGE